MSERPLREYPRITQVRLPARFHPLGGRHFLSRQGRVRGHGHVHQWEVREHRRKLHLRLRLRVSPGFGSEEMRRYVSFAFKSLSVPRMINLNYSQILTSACRTRVSMGHASIRRVISSAFVHTGSISDRTDDPASITAGTFATRKFAMDSALMPCRIP